jgi:putative restriction endonuclease
MSDSVYAQPFARLRSDVKPYWPEATFNRAPHKPILLLTIMDLIANQRIKSNFIELDVELSDIFDLYWHKVFGDERDSNILMPFWHMTSEGFWHLVAVPGKEIALASVGKIRSFRQYSQLALGARFDDELFALLEKPSTRDELRRILIEKYFAPNLRPDIVHVGVITSESFEYGRELINRAKRRFTLKEAPSTETYITEVRSVAFRRVVISAYKQTCAFCNIRIVTPDGRAGVDAAHIVPWSHSHNDDPRNGIALCGLHHWSFDQGLIGIKDDYHIMVSPVVSVEENAAEALLKLDHQPIYLPIDQILQPARSALIWHRENVFWREIPPRLL